MYIFKGERNMTKRDYNRTIYEEINHKINSLNKVRVSRIQASKRLYR